MHGGTLTGEILPRYTKALREEPFAFQGKTLGPADPRDGRRGAGCNAIALHAACAAPTVHLCSEGVRDDGGSQI